MRPTPILVFVPGAWHAPSCYDRVIQLLEHEHNVRCIGVTLPSTQNNPEATFKDDIDAVRSVIEEEISLGRDVLVIAHSYGGMVGNSAIRGFTPPATPSSNERQGYIQGLILIASGFTLTGVAFMDPFFGHPPPSWRINTTTGYAELLTPPRELFYHDIPEDEAKHYTDNITTQSLKALFEGGEHAYAGWMDVPRGCLWYIGTTEDRGNPVVAQRLNVGMARGCGVLVEHVELVSSHSPFVSLPEETVGIIMRAVEGVVPELRVNCETERSVLVMSKVNIVPWARWASPTSWLRYGIPLSLGRMLGWGLSGYIALRGPWRRA